MHQPEVRPLTIYASHTVGPRDHRSMQAWNSADMHSLRFTSPDAAWMTMYSIRVGVPDVAPARASDAADSPFSRTIDELDLLAEGKLYDDEPLPTSEAYKTTRLLLLRTARRLEGVGPHGHLLSEPPGGVRAEWDNGPKCVTLMVGPDDTARSYIHRYGSGTSELISLSESNTDRDLAAWLIWLAT